MLGAVAVAQLIGGFVAMTLLGGFQDLFAVQIVIATLVSSVAVLVLGVGWSRGTSPASAARLSGSAAERPHAQLVVLEPPRARAARKDDPVPDHEATAGVEPAQQQPVRPEGEQLVARSAAGPARSGRR